MIEQMFVIVVFEAGFDGGPVSYTQSKVPWRATTRLVPAPEMLESAPAKPAPTSNHGAAPAVPLA